MLKPLRLGSFEAARDVRSEPMSMLALAYAVSREVLRIAPRLTVALLMAVVLLTAVRAYMTIAVGELLGVVGKVAGSGSHAVGQLLGWLLCVMFGSLALHAIGPFLEAYYRVLSRAVDCTTRLRLMRAVNAPHEIGHLEDPLFLNRLRDAQALGTSEITLGDAVATAMRTLQTRLATLSSALILIGFRWWLALLLLVGGSLLRAHFAREQIASARSTTTHSQALRRADYFRGLASDLPAAKEVRVFGLQAWLLAAFEKHWSAAMAPIWRTRRALLSSALKWHLVWSIAIAWSFYLLASAALDGSVSIAELAIYIQALIALGLVGVGDDDVRLAFGLSAYPSLRLVEASVTAPSDAQSGHEEAPTELRDGIEFRDISFRYPGATTDLYTRLNLSIEAGRSLALVGLNGAGKTTLIKLLARLYSPHQGSIIADGVDIRRYRPESWQRRIAVVFQDFVRYPLSAYQNIAFQQPDEHARARVRAAVEAAGIERVLARLPNGLDTVLWREVLGGAELSGGEWQRLAIARSLFAISSGASVLVLDEPTANIDPASEPEVMRRLLELVRGTTTIIISHRLSTIRHADRIAVISEGEVAEHGPHDTLMAQDGIYAQMYKLQAARFERTEDGA